MLGSIQVPVGGEQEVDRLTVPVDGTVQVAPLPPDPSIVVQGHRQVQLRKSAGESDALIDGVAGRDDASHVLPEQVD